MRNRVLERYLEGGSLVLLDPNGRVTGQGTRESPHAEQPAGRNREFSRGRPEVVGGQRTRIHDLSVRILKQDSQWDTRRGLEPPLAPVAAIHQGLVVQLLQRAIDAAIRIDERGAVFTRFVKRVKLDEPCIERDTRAVSGNNKVR